MRVGAPCARQPETSIVTVEQPGFARLALTGVAWSIVQSWGGRAVAFLLFVVLARFLSPAEFGLVGAASIILTLVTLIAGFGLNDAVVQRPNYQRQDGNLPFFGAMGASLLLGGLAAFNADRIEGWLDVAGLAPVAVAISLVAPIVTMADYQDAHYQRAFRFRQLALRVLIANLVAGAVAVTCAVLGFGVWSLVVQAYVASVVGMLWLWWRPVWRPSLEIRPRAALEMLSFGAPVAAMRLMNFGSTRFFEVMLLARFGFAVYGLYVAGAKLHQVMTQLLLGALYKVSLTVLSKVAQDRARLSRLYHRALTLAAVLPAPLFVCCAAVIPEIADVLFGAKWTGLEDVARPLLLLGAVQSIGFVNEPFLAARGRSGLLGIEAAIRCAGIVAFAFVPSEQISGYVLMFVIGSLSGTPFAFAFVMRDLEVGASSLVSRLLPAVAGCAAGYFAVAMLRPELPEALAHPLLSGTALGIAFYVVFAAVVGVLGFGQLRELAGFLRERLADRA